MWMGSEEQLGELRLSPLGVRASVERQSHDDSLRAEKSNSVAPADQPADQQPADRQQPADQPAETISLPTTARRPKAGQPAEQQPAEQQPAEHEPADQQPADRQQPADQQPCDSFSVEPARDFDCDMIVSVPCL